MAGPISCSVWAETTRILGDGSDTVLDGGLGTDKLIVAASGSAGRVDLCGFEALELIGGVQTCTMSQATLFKAGFTATLRC